jgi:Sec-independent protein translocase protein TatA
MESVFGIGLGELLVILILAGLVLGPQRMRQVAWTLGRSWARLRRAGIVLLREVNAELDALDGGELRAAVSEAREIGREVAGVPAEWRAAVAGDGEKAGRPASGQPPSATPEPDRPPAEAAPAGAIPRPLQIEEDPD